MWSSIVLSLVRQKELWWGGVAGTLRSSAGPTLWQAGVKKASRKRQHRQSDCARYVCGESGLYRLHDTLRISLRYYRKRGLCDQRGRAELRAIITDAGAIESL